ncbi:MAG: septum formation inhibitor Maf [Clostridia bacterium]|nr:septum formation inhibitor Maf [Clostridia bacterium]
MNQSKLILASNSPRRRELLAMIGANFTVLTADCDEYVKKGTPPDQMVQELALRKANAAAALLTAENNPFPIGTVIIGADTVVCDRGRILGKPRDEADAVETLLSLSGHSHKVYTGIAAVGCDKILTDAVCTTVRFSRLTRDEAERYVATGEPMDKAGAYGIQGIGGIFVTGIDGDYYNVVGLPIARLRIMLSEGFGCRLI